LNKILSYFGDSKSIELVLSDTAKNIQ